MLPFWGRVPITGDEPHYLLMSQSILRDGDLDLKNDYAENRYAGFYERGQLEPQNFRSRQGIIAPGHSPGLAVLILPASALAWIHPAAALWGAWILMSLVAAATGGLCLDTALRLGGKPKASLWIVGALFMGSPFGVQAAQIFPALCGAACLLLAWRGLDLMQGPKKREAFFYLCLGCLALPWLNLRFWYFSVAILALVWWRSAKSSRLAPALCLSSLWIISTGLFAWFQFSHYGSPWPWAMHLSGGTDVVRRSLTARLSTRTGPGLLALFLDPLTAWILHATPLLAFPWALKKLDSDARSRAWPWVVIALGYMVLLSGTTPIMNSHFRYQIPLWILLASPCVAALSGLEKHRPGLLLVWILPPWIWGSLIWVVPWFRYPPRHGPPWPMALLSGSSMDWVSRVLPSFHRWDAGDVACVLAWCVLCVFGLIMTILPPRSPNNLPASLEQKRENTSSQRDKL